MISSKLEKATLKLIRIKKKDINQHIYSIQTIIWNRKDHKLFMDDGSDQQFPLWNTICLYGPDGRSSLVMVMGVFLDLGNCRFSMRVRTVKILVLTVTCINFARFITSRNILNSAPPPPKNPDPKYMPLTSFWDAGCKETTGQDMKKRIKWTN